MDNLSPRQNQVNSVASLVAVTLFSVALVAIRRIDPSAESQSLSVHGVLDWTGHLLTAGIVAIGLASWRRPVAPMAAILLGGVLPDVGHLLTWADLAVPVTGSTRNGTHSAVVVAAFVVAALVDRPRRAVWLGIGIGIVTHLWRDMGTGTVPLLWPWSDRVFSVSFTTYVVVTALVGLSLVLIGRAGRIRVM